MPGLPEKHQLKRGRSLQKSHLYVLQKRYSTTLVDVCLFSCCVVVVVVVVVVINLGDT